MREESTALLSHYVDGIPKVQKEQKGQGSFYTSYKAYLLFSFYLPGILSWSCHFNCCQGLLSQPCSLFSSPFYLLSPKQLIPDRRFVLSHFCSSDNSLFNITSTDIFLLTVWLPPTWNRFPGKLPAQEACVKVCLLGETLKRFNLFYLSTSHCIIKLPFLDYTWVITDALSKEIKDSLDIKKWQ